MAETPNTPPQPVVPRRRKSPLRKLVLVLLALPLALILFLTVQFLVQRQSAWDFIPKQFQVYLQVPSISKVYDEWSQLDALHIAFRENPGLAGLEKSLLSLKSSGISDSPLFRALIDVQAHVVITRKNEALLILDLGWRSALTRQIPLVAGMVHLDGLSITQKNGHSWFEYNWSKGAPGASVYILFLDNLALISFKPEVIETLPGLKTAGLALSDIEKTRINEEFSKPDSGSLRFLVDPASFSDSFITSPILRQRINSNLSWKDSALVSLDISNDAFSMQAATILESKQEAINALLTHKNTVLNSLRSIPASAYFYTALSLGDFRQLLQAWTLFSGQDLTPTLATVEEGSKVLLGMSSDELLWSWAGDEAGMFYLGNNGDPVFHLKIKDEGKRQRTFQKLNDSALVDIDKSLVLDTVPISRIVIPDFFKGLIGLFGVSFDTPYYIVYNDELFLSMNAENLARLSNEARDGKLLYRSPEFEHMMANTAKNPAVFLYYDLDKSIPFFLRESNLLSRVLKLYNRGTFSLFINDGYLSISMGAVRVEQRKTVAFPGFPLAIKGGLSTPPWVGFLQGRSDPVVASIQNSHELTLDALAGSERLMTVPVESGSQLLPMIWGNEILAWAPTGTFYRFDPQGQAISPFPVLTPSQGSFVPVQFEDKLLAYSRTENSLLTVSRDGSVTMLPTVLDAPILTAPAVRGSLAAVAPKSFEGSVLLIDRNGVVQPGWPREGGGIALASPVFIDTPEGLSIAFLTQNGKLNVWRNDGTDRSGFPIDLHAVFSAAPVAIQIEGQTVLALLDQSGMLSLVKLDGSLLREGQIAGANLEARLFAKDIDGDKSDEIFLYGGKNNLDGFDTNLQRLPGFPVRGSYQPQFVDLKFDGKPELISGSWDGNIYAYIIKK